MRNSNENKKIDGTPARARTSKDKGGDRPAKTPRRHDGVEAPRDRRDVGGNKGKPPILPSINGQFPDDTARDDAPGTGAAVKSAADGRSEGPTDNNSDVQKERLSSDMKDAFKRFRGSQLAARSSRVALALSQLMRIRLPYPRQIEAMAEIEELRLLGLEMQGEQQLALNIFNRTGTGKSTIASQYKLMRAEEDAPGVKSVLHARLGTSGSPRDLHVAVMSELGDGFASSGTEHTLRRRAMEMMEKAGTQLLILDETQHSGQRSGFSRDVTAELKILLDTGRVPIVLLGTEAAVPIVAADRELAGRMFSPCRLDPLDVDDTEDFEMWQGFVGGLDRRMVKDGIVTAPAGLADEEIAYALGDVCDGVIGQFMRVMTMALRFTIREGRDVVTVEDIADAVDEWSLELGFSTSNPFRK